MFFVKCKYVLVKVLTYNILRKSYYVFNEGYYDYAELLSFYDSLSLLAQSVEYSIPLCMKNVGSNPT